MALSHAVIGGLFHRITCRRHFCEDHNAPHQPVDQLGGNGISAESRCPACQPDWGSRWTWAGYGHGGELRYERANVNDDNTVGWPKTHFSSHDLTYTKQAYIDREYLVEDTNGTTEFNFEDNIINGTDQDWPGISISLGMDLGKNFIPLTVGTLDMDWPDTDSGPATPGFTKDHTTYAITWKDNIIPAGKSRVFFYSVDIPDWDPEAMPEAEIEGGYIFTIRAEPLVAEGKGEGLMFGGRRVDMTKSSFADRDRVVLPPPFVVAGQPRLVVPTLSPSDINIPHPSVTTDTGGVIHELQGQKSADAITFKVDDHMALEV